VEEMTKFFTDKNGRKRTMYGKPRWKGLSNIIDETSPEAAKAAVVLLEDRFNDADSSIKELRIIRAMVLAKNRAHVTANRKDVSLAARKNAAEVEKIYEGSRKKLSALHKENKKEYLRRLSDRDA
jgi:hypothetical protein